VMKIVIGLLHSIISDKRVINLFLNWPMCDKLLNLSDCLGYLLTYFSGII